MWWKLLLDLQLFLQQQANLTDVNIEMGASACVPEQSTVQLVRGTGTPDWRGRFKQGKQTVFVDCWAHDERDPETAYQQLDELEQYAFAAIRLWGQQGSTIEGVHARAMVKDSEPDGDLFRPSVGSRTLVEIEWTRKN